MDRNFARALKLVLKHEGGYVNHPKDPGGPTNLGITLATFRKFVKPSGTIEELKKLTPEQAGTCYRRMYWDAVLGAELPDGVDYAAFDFAVNSGPGRAAKYLQGVVGAVADGKIGPATVKAATAKLPATVIHDLCDARLAFMQGLKKLWPTFRNGWSARVKEVRSEALKMASAPASVAAQRVPAPPVPELRPKPEPAPAPPQDGVKPDVILVEGPKKDETTVVIVPHPDNPPSAPSDIPKSRTGLMAIGAILLAIITWLAERFGG